MISKIKVKAPATTANVGSSFDCLGIAVELFNHLTIEISDEDEYSYNSTKQKIENNFIFIT